MNKKLIILILNTGSTSTKVAIYEDKKEKIKTTISYSSKKLSEFDLVSEQRDMRKQEILSFLKNENFDITTLDAIVSRGGSTLPVEGGAYYINDVMVNRLKNKPFVQHAGILGPVIAREIADDLGIKSYVYDSPATDELDPISRISGMKEIERVSLVHALNSRYVTKKVCIENNKKYNGSNYIVAHIGGGITITLHSKGRIRDVVGDDEGPFSPERAGGVPSRQLVDLCFKEKYCDKDSVHNIMRGNGGLASYLGTNSAVEVEKMIKKGNKYAELIYKAMALQISKGIASLAVTVSGEIDGIILTGAIANSKVLTSWIKERVRFIADIYIIEGDFEIEALCEGVFRAIIKEEAIKEYIE